MVKRYTVRWKYNGKLTDAQPNKSFFTFDGAMRFASGLNFLGRELKVSSVAVVYDRKLGKQVSTSLY